MDYPLRVPQINRAWLEWRDSQIQGFTNLLIDPSTDLLIDCLIH